MGNRAGKHELAVRRALQTEGTCGFIKKDGTPCQKKAGWGTDHPSVGYCNSHEKYSLATGPRVPGKRYRNGVGAAALEFYTELAEDPEITRLDDEISLLRLRLNDISNMINDIRARYVGKSPEGQDRQRIRMGEYLHAAYGEKADASATLDQKALLQLTRDSAKMAEAISKLVAQKTRIEEGRIVTYRQVQEVLAQVIYVIRKHVVDEEQLSRIADDFTKIDVSKLEPK